MTVREAAARLGMSPSWFREVAKAEGLEVRRRSRQPGVNWATVEIFIARSKVPVSKR